jgi:hypothetical protein
MSDFYTDFLHQPDSVAGGRDRTFAHVAVFGKHPAWDDHMDDIGVDLPTILEAKRLLYTQGIATQLDTDVWAKLPVESLTESYDHWLLWHRVGETIVGRLLPTSDGKGRFKYPLVLFAFFKNVPLASAVAAAIGPLARLAEKIPAAATRDAVRSLVRETRSGLAVELENTGDIPAPFAVGQRPVLDATGWARVIHGSAEELSEFAPFRSSFAAPNGRHLRLPAIANVGHSAENLLWWATFFFGQLRPTVPALYLFREDTAVVDAIVGLPAATYFRCLRVADNALQPLNEVPYRTAPSEEELARKIAATSGFPEQSIFAPHDPIKNVLPLVGSQKSLADALHPGLFGGILKLFGKL